MRLLRQVFLIVSTLSIAAVVSSASQSSQSESTEKTEVWRLDPFGGYSALYSALGEQNEEGETIRTRLSGWGAGATIRFPTIPWLGVTGSYSQNGKDGARIRHYRVGSTLTTTYGGDYFSRGFVHVLVGGSSLSSPNELSESGFELNAGGGLDMFGVFRLQFDWTRLDLPGYPANIFAVFVGGVLPLCFGGSAEDCFAIK